MKYSDVDYAITVSDPKRNTNPGQSCMDVECENYYYITYGRQYFMLVNWDFTEKKKVKYKVFDIGAT